jgi:hypothetical protein
LHFGAVKTWGLAERERDGSLFKPGEYRFIKRIHDDIPENKPVSIL